MISSSFLYCYSLNPDLNQAAQFSNIGTKFKEIKLLSFVTFLSGIIIQNNKVPFFIQSQTVIVVIDKFY
jgi:hypothetical protein